jgi:hypothetical protein
MLLRRLTLSTTKDVVEQDGQVEVKLPKSVKFGCGFGLELPYHPVGCFYPPPLFEELPYSFGLEACVGGEYE